MDLQLRAKEYLKRYGIKKKYLASLVGIYPSQLSQWLSGDYDLNTNQIKIIKIFAMVSLNIQKLTDKMI